MLKDQIAANRVRTWFLLMMSMVMLGGVFLAIWAIYGLGSGFLIIGALLAVVSPWVIYYKSDSLVIAATGAVDADPVQYKALHNIVEELSLASGMTKPRVMIVDDPAPNAFATGRNPERAVIAATTGLLAKMDREQVQGVMAHELSHVRNNDMLVGTIAASVAGMVLVLSNIAIRMTLFGRSRSVNPIVLVIAIVGLLLAPIGAMLLKASVSRRRETLADYSAADMTRNPSGLRRALETLAEDSTVVRRVSMSTAHLWIEEPKPKGGGMMSYMNNLLATHPPIEERIAAMRQLEGGA